MSGTDANGKPQDVRASTRQLLISAATELLNERGTAGLTMTAVARRADVAVRTVYNHFRSADELVLAMSAAVTKQFAKLRPAKSELTERAPEDTLRRFVEHWFAEFDKAGRRIDALMSVRGLTELEDAVSELRELRMRHLRTVLTEAQRRDLLRVSLDEALTVAYVATTYQAWVALVSELGSDVSAAAELAVRWVAAFAFRQGATLEARTSQPGGRGDVADVAEESPDSAGQGGG